MPVGYDIGLLVMVVGCTRRLWHGLLVIAVGISDGYGTYCWLWQLVMPVGYTRWLWHGPLVITVGYTRWLWHRLLVMTVGYVMDC